VINNGPFGVSCDAGPTGRLQASSDALKITVFQRLDGAPDSELWESVIIVCKKLEDGSATVQVTICHPEWNEPIRVPRFGPWDQELEACPHIGL
jgi:hypothetical protein